MEGVKAKLKTGKNLLNTVNTISFVLTFGALRSHCIMVEIKNWLIYIETRLSAGRANAWWYYDNQMSSSISTQIPS